MGIVTLRVWLLPSSPPAILKDSLYREPIVEQKHVMGLLLFTSVFWATWRFWRFTLYPMLHPDEPKELPYLLPSK